jgi:peroxiredoxin
MNASELSSKHPREFACPQGRASRLLAMLSFSRQTRKSRARYYSCPVKLLLLLAALAVAGCTASHAPRLPRDPRLAGGSGALVGRHLPPFEGSLIGTGKTASLREFSGKPLIVVVWTSHNDDSLAELRDLQHLRPFLKKKVTIVGVDTDETQDEYARSFLRDSHVTFPNLIDRQVQLGGGSFYWEYQEAVFTDVLPTTLVIRPDGIVVAAFSGATSTDQIETALHSISRQMALTSH